MIGNIKSKIQNWMNTYNRELENSIGSPNSLLDIGCGSNSPIQYFKKRIEYKVGVDGFENSLKESHNKNIHDKYVKANLLEIDNVIGKNLFDCVIALDVIEHFEKNEGYKLLELMENISKDIIVIFTPNGFLPQAEHSNNPLQVHRSGWTAKEMEDMGYQVIGINGWKPLLGELAKPRFYPKSLCLLLSRLSQYYVRNHPQHAFQLLCVKSLTDKQ